MLLATFVSCGVLLLNCKDCQCCIVRVGLQWLQPCGNMLCKKEKMRMG